MEIKCKLSEVDDIIYEHQDELGTDDVTLTLDEDNMVELSDYYVYIPDLDLSIKEGVFFTRYEDGEMVADWDGSVFFPGKMDSYEYLYYEQDGFEISVHNFLWGIGEPEKEKIFNCILYLT